MFILASNEFSCRDVSHEPVDASDEDTAASGVSIKQTLRGMHLEYCIMGKKEVCISFLLMSITNKIMIILGD